MAAKFNESFFYGPEDSWFRDRGQTDMYIFPADLEQYKHWISFKFNAFQRRSVDDRTFHRPKGGLRLPIPSNLIDNMQVAYGTTEISALFGTLIDGAESILSGGNEAKLKELGINTGAGGLANLAQAAFGKNARDLGLGLAGLAVNPFLTVLFKSPVFKRHRFQWRLAPTTETETHLVANIANKFKYHMLPEIFSGSAGGFTAGTNVLLTYPDMVDVALWPSDQFMYSFKPCVIESVETNYAPDSPAFFKSPEGAPAQIVITVNLLEIEYWLKQDIKYRMEREAIE